MGVVPDLALNPGSPAEGDGVYIPLTPTTVTRLAITTRGNPVALVPPLHQEVLGLAPRPQVQWTKTLTAQMAEPVAIFRALGLGLSALGTIALVLAAAGVYALRGVAGGAIVAYGITQLVATIPFAIQRRAGVGVAGVLAVLALVAALGCAIPVRRALRLRPSELLR